MSAQPLPGTCRHCHCREDRPCTLPDGDSCAWFDNQRTICTAPACLLAHFRELEWERRRREQRTRRRSPAEILEIRRQEQLQRRRRARAAKGK